MEKPSEISILVLDDDPAAQNALADVFDGEGWRVHSCKAADEAMAELARGGWTLALVNVALPDVRDRFFPMLKDLSQANADAGGGRKRLRILFVAPRTATRWAQPLLEREALPYVTKPLHLHDFLEKVSDLLLEAEAISSPIRTVRLPAVRERRPKRRTGRDKRDGKMFASREDYMMTEEEIAEFEKQEEEAKKKRIEEQKRREML